MWLTPIAEWLVLAAIASGAGVPASDGAMPEPISTRQTLFAIPFRIEQPTEPSQEPVEVQLYVSADRGTTWHLHRQVAPARRHFVFRAAADGEYWFIVRTLDRSGYLRPERVEVPGLRVVVDTTLPQLQLQARRGRAGWVEAHWEIDELHPKPDSLSIQYRIGENGPWQTVALDRQDFGPTGSLHTGKVTWLPKAGSTVVQIRAEVADSAGNVAVNHAHLEPLEVADSRSGYPPPGSTPAEIRPAIGNRHVSPGPLGSAPREPRPQMIDSRRFELDYDVASIGPSDIARVELWGTRDNGTTWSSHVFDDDNRSPLLVEVDEDGIYGFRVVVAGRAGRGGQPPQSGELPDIVIGVDTTKPTARILSFDRGVGLESGHLVIAFEAADRMPATRPISLWFATTSNGPWTPLVTELENTGRYVWPIDDRLPGRVYLRLEVRDEAGNVGSFDTAEPIAPGQLRPTVEIRNVRPMNRAARTPPNRTSRR